MSTEPSRPLLIGYLVAKEVLQRADADFLSMSPAEGWHYLLDQICQREAQIEAGIDAETVRVILEKLATKVRQSADRSATLFAADVNEVFRSVCGYHPDDMAQKLLLRLPGLGALSQDDGSRSFVDQDLCDTAAAGDVYRFIVGTYANEHGPLREIQSELSDIGADVCAVRCANSGVTDKQLSNALKHAANELNASMLALDLFRTLQHCEFPYADDHVSIRDISINELAVGVTPEDYSRIQFNKCWFGILDIEKDALLDRLPRFLACTFLTVRGRVGPKDMPGEIFSNDCEYGEFADEAHTTSDFLRLDLPIGVKVLLTVLKKLFVQKGTGRQEAAFTRGLDHREQRYVSSILNLVAGENIAFATKLRNRTVWIPERQAGNRVMNMLSAPTNSTDSLIAKCRELS